MFTLKHLSALFVGALLLLIGLDHERIQAKSKDGHNRTNVAGVLLGPCDSAIAQGPNGSDDDYSNASINSPSTPEGLTTNRASVVFKNTVENAGTGDDAFIITIPSSEPGFAFEISNDSGEHYQVLYRSASNVTLPVPHNASVTFFIRIMVPAGLKALTGYDTVVRATSTIDPAVTNETIDRIYTGFIRLDSAARIVGPNSTPDISRAVPGSELEFAVTYANISSAGGVGNSLLTARNLVINENGNAAPNNWATTTEHIVGASDNHGGQILGDSEGSTSLTLIVARLEPGQSGVFKFRRRIR
ncbi:MAG TPA: hypothetical protein VHP99_04330 [Pyrinomonadaceae bacterium]|nr:hypothetical protein [Pyrinomonadaceae bacterium]